MNIMAGNYRLVKKSEMGIISEFVGNIGNTSQGITGLLRSLDIYRLWFQGVFFLNTLVLTSLQLAKFYYDCSEPAVLQHKVLLMAIDTAVLCCNWELGKYQKVESSHLVADYKHNLSLLN